jgi:hypothetical protein
MHWNDICAFCIVLYADMKFKTVPRQLRSNKCTISCTINQIRSFGYQFQLHLWGNKTYNSLTIWIICSKSYFKYFHGCVLFQNIKTKINKTITHIEMHFRCCGCHRLQWELHDHYFLVLPYFRFKYLTKCFQRSWSLPWRLTLDKSDKLSDRWTILPFDTTFKKQTGIKQY